jgi:RHS repeat-associated protein
MRKLFKFLALMVLALAWSVVHAQATGTVTYLYTDPQGTILAKADAAGTITATFDYTPYGSTAIGSPPNGPGYTGHVNDPETSLVYMQARYYDPVTGRFLSVDPNSSIPADSFSFNRYAYTNNNPIKNVDRDGRSPFEIVFLVADIVQLGVAIKDGEGVGAAVAMVGIDVVGVASPVPGISEAAHALEAAHDVAEVAKVAKEGKSVGTYVLKFRSGAEYVGKGTEKRMARSASKLSREHGDEVVEKTFKAAENDREALKEESRIMESKGGPRSKNPNTKLYNKIDSPGTKYRQQDGETPMPQSGEPIRGSN